MGTLFKSVMAINLAIVVLQVCVLGFQIYRWNEIVGAVFSIVISFIGFLPSALGESRTRWFIGFYALLLVADLLFETINMILLINFQWVVIQFCIHLNVSVDISYYGGVACNDWWHFGYGEINHRDRAMIVTILMAIVIILRLIQIIASLVVYLRHLPKSVVYVPHNARNYAERDAKMSSGGRLFGQDYVTHI